MAKQKPDEQPSSGKSTRPATARRKPAAQATKGEPPPATDKPPSRQSARAAAQQNDGAVANVARAAADIHRPASGAKRTTRSSAERVALAYFQAIRAHDLERAVSLWAPGGRENVRGQIDGPAPETVRELVGGLLQAIPDLDMEVVSHTSQGDRCAVQWRLTGTFAGPGRLNGIAPTGRPIALEGIHLMRVSGGLIQGNDVYSDSLTMIRQIGMLPAQGSAAELRMFGAFNAKTRLTEHLFAEPRKVAPGVWVVQGQPGRYNVYLIENDPSQGGVTLFDAGPRAIVRGVAGAAARLGGLRTIILGHGHTDHRGTAPALEAPVLCHPDEVQDAQGSGGFRYWPSGLRGLPAPQRQVHLLLHRRAWDGGPVQISKTLAEGDRVAGGFEIIHLPGHAPGLIGLWRGSDRLALVSDCFYTVDLWGRDRRPHLPPRTYNHDSRQARASILKLAALQPAAVWPGRGRAVTADVPAQLQAAADRD